MRVGVDHFGFVLTQLELSYNSTITSTHLTVIVQGLRHRGIAISSIVPTDFATIMLSTSVGRELSCLLSLLCILLQQKDVFELQKHCTSGSVAKFGI